MADPSGSEPPWRVLLVEDEYFLADDLRREFEQAGASIIGPVATVARALALLDAVPPPDAAVLDINLQDGMVWPLAEALESRATPYVFSSGYVEAILPARFKGTPLFHKPIEAGLLIEALRQRQGLVDAGR